MGGWKGGEEGGRLESEEEEGRKRVGGMDCGRMRWETGRLEG